MPAVFSSHYVISHISFRGTVDAVISYCVCLTVDKPIASFFHLSSGACGFVIIVVIIKL